MRGMWKSTTSQCRRTRSFRGHIQAGVRARVPRVLHPRLVHRGQEADLPLLQGEGGPQEDDHQPLGPAAHFLRTALGLDQVAGGVAAAHHLPIPRHQLVIWTRIDHTSRRHHCMAKQPLKLFIFGLILAGIV